MKVSREQAAHNRERVLEVAAEQFRQKGFDGISVADVMKQAGLTHGGFYGQFDSKEDLMAQACTRAFDHLMDSWKPPAQPDPAGQAKRLKKITQSYLSPAHRDHPEAGCVVAALGGEVARQGPALRAAVAEGIRTQLQRLEALMPQATAEQRRQHAVEAYAAMVGALLLARVVADDGDLSNELLQRNAKGVLGHNSQA